MQRVLLARSTEPTSPKPTPIPCPTCGETIEPVWISWGEGRWVGTDCRPCVERQREEQRRAERVTKAREYLTSRSRIPERLQGYRLDRSLTPSRGETFAAFRARCAATRSLGITPGNAAAVAAVKAYAPPACLYLCGPVGTGKSTIASALAYRVACESDYSPVYVAEAQLWERREDGSYLDRTAKQAYFLWLDDFGATEAPKDWQREMMESVICQRYAECRPTVFTSNHPLATMTDRWGERVGSRLVEMLAGNVVEVGGADWRRA